MGYYSHHNMKWPTERGVFFFSFSKRASEGIEIRVWLAFLAFFYTEKFSKFLGASELKTHWYIFQKY